MAGYAPGPIRGEDSSDSSDSELEPALPTDEDIGQLVTLTNKLQSSFILKLRARKRARRKVLEMKRLRRTMRGISPMAPLAEKLSLAETHGDVNRDQTIKPVTRAMIRKRFELLEQLKMPNLMYLVEQVNEAERAEKVVRDEVARLGGLPALIERFQRAILADVAGVAELPGPAEPADRAVLGERDELAEPAEPAAPAVLAERAELDEPPG